MSGGEAAEEESEEGGDAAVEHGEADEAHRGVCPLLPGARAGQEGVGDVDSVVHTEADTEHNVDAGDDVNSDVPKVKKANDVGKTDGNHEDDHETDLDVAEEEECDDDHSSDRKAKVTPQLGT